MFEIDSTSLSYTNAYILVLIGMLLTMLICAILYGRDIKDIQTRYDLMSKFWDEERERTYLYRKQVKELTNYTNYQGDTIIKAFRVITDREQTIAYLEKNITNLEKKLRKYEKEC